VQERWMAKGSGGLGETGAADEGKGWGGDGGDTGGSRSEMVADALPAHVVWMKESGGIDVNIE